jgi:SAM-dependent methyltransferase
MSSAESLSCERFSTVALDDHFAVLAETVFQTKSKWPHFELLLNDVRRLAEVTPASATVVSMERGLLYGGCSLIAPFFQDHKFIALDCSPPSAEERGSYNGAMIDDPRCLFVPATGRGDIEKTGLDADMADLVLVPNLIHHVADQEGLFFELARIVRPEGQVYVFEPLLRELHQIPDDYLRWTPYGMARAMGKVGLEAALPTLTGGPFEAIAYCWAQALEYLPDEKRAEMSSWFYDTHMPELMAWDAACDENKVRGDTSFPVAFSILARKLR